MEKALMKKVEAEFPPRALTRKEVKDLRKKGFNLAMISVENADEAMDTALAMVYDDEQIKALDEKENQVSLALFERIVEKTYGRGETEKK